MRFALVNPAWRFDGSIYFGCREPHLPLELGYAAASIRAAGGEATIVDAPLEGLDADALAAVVTDIRPDYTVVTTAPTYLFWRCPPPELRAPLEILSRLRGAGGATVAIGPHGSVTPGAVLRKLGVDLVLRGEPEDALASLAAGAAKETIEGAAFCADRGRLVTIGAPAAARFVDAPPLRWPDTWIRRPRHHHHRFDAHERGPAAEVEASRGCPYACTFCAKIDFRDRYRRRRLDLLLDEIDGLVAQGARYLYFIDEIFLPDRRLLAALKDRDVQFGIQTRIDLWSPDMLESLGEAGCVSIEAGVESITSAGRAALAKKCRDDTSDLVARLLKARAHVPFVQANLLASPDDDASSVEAFRRELARGDVWSNDPVPLYPYPSSPAYRSLFGLPDDLAWERAHDHYLATTMRYSDLQSDAPCSLAVLETP